MAEDVRMNSIIWGYILHIRPYTTQKDIKGLRWINDWDLFIEFIDGEKYIYDTYSKFFKAITYDRYTITEEQFRNEFRDKLNSIMKRKNIDQESLANKIGSSQQMISRYCTGNAMPSQYVIHKIAIALDCNDSDLLYQEY